ncbi:hypothetical protein PMAC_002350, partial [Pneumocystis sp. 'macacae']
MSTQSRLRWTGGVGRKKGTGIEWQSLHRSWNTQSWKVVGVCTVQIKQGEQEIGVGGRKNRVKSFFLVNKRRARTRWRGVRDDEVSVCTKQLGRVGEVGCEKNVYRTDEVVCTKQRGGTRCTIRREGGGEVSGRQRGRCAPSSEVGGVHEAPRWECAEGSTEGSEADGVHQATMRWAQVGEVGCEKSVYGADKVGVHQEGGEVEGYKCVCAVLKEVEMESRSNKIEEVEVEVEIRFRLALRV